MRFGTAGPPVARLGLGSLALSGVYGKVDAVESVRLIHHALDVGANLLDTGERSAWDSSQQIIRRAVYGRRDEVVLVGHARSRAGAGDAARLAAECDARLRGLGVDHLDLYCLHPDGGSVPIEERIGALAGLVRSGKVGRLGLYGVSADELARAHRVHPLALLAVEYSLWHREPERTCLPVARELGIGVLACQPLGRGYLTGQLVSPDQLAPTDPRRVDPRFSRHQLAARRPRLRRLEQIAAAMDVGAGRLALAWLLARGADIVPVPSTSSDIHLEMNLSALGMRLTPEVTASLDAAWPLPGAQPR